MKQQIYTSLFVLYTALVAFVSLKPIDSAYIGSYDKLGHLLTYAIFAALLTSRLVSAVPASGRRS